MSIQKIYNARARWFRANWEYELTEYSMFDYSILEKIVYQKKSGRGSNDTYNDIIIMFDTETSKKRNYSETNRNNHVVAFTVSLRAFGLNIATLYGHKPSELIKCMSNILKAMKGAHTIFYAHNMAYDYTFIRRFLFREFGTPDKQLSTKPHYPILLEWNGGLIIKDSLILAQRSLKKWAEDLDVEHKKEVGADTWDYGKQRNQDAEFSEANLRYIEHDTLAGVECIDATLSALHKKVWNAPFTATGIPREEVRHRGHENNAREKFQRKALTFDDYIKATGAYHGGYTHGNRHLIDYTISEENFGRVKCFDFSSSYPFCMLVYKYACEKFMPLLNKTPEYIIERSDNYAFLFKLIARDIKLKDYLFPMPVFQFSKCIQCINPILDNGRIIEADYAEIYLTELDLALIMKQYDFKGICTEVSVARKDYLPRWFTDYVYELYYKKCTLKNAGDPVAYALAKSCLNSLYGMLCQKCIRDEIEEDFETGEYTTKVLNMEEAKEAYDKYLKNRNSILPYDAGVWVTAYALTNLYTLGACAGVWVYSDTDSCYGIDWNYEAVEEYNKNCEALLRANGYEPVEFGGRRFVPGAAESEGEKDEYTEFRVMGAKRYCGRNAKDGEIHITVAGVPKIAAKALNNDIEKFTKGFIFDGITSGKLTHTYLYSDIYIDEDGNETADSIDLTPCDYLLDTVNLDFLDLTSDDYYIEIFG